MSDVTVGQITSTPDADGNHRMKCPQCHSEFLTHITRDDDTKELDNTICEACSHSGGPVEFLYLANEAATNKMVGSYVTKRFKKAFVSNKQINVG